MSSRKPADWHFIRGKPKPLVLLDDDSLSVFNTRFPLTILEQAAQSELIPPPIRKEIALAAWARAGLIDQPESQRRLIRLVKEQWPTLAADLDSLTAAVDPVERKRAFIYAVLRHPGIRPALRGSTHRATPIERIDNLRDNWWCGMEGSLDSLKSNREYQTLRDYQRRNPGKKLAAFSQASADVPTFLSESETADAERQIQRLRTIETGPNYLSAQAIQWAKDAPNDPRVPEALHLAVRTTRYGCVDDETPGFSKAAFRLLHRRYPNSDWAKKTKYWY